MKTIKLPLKNIALLFMLILYSLTAFCQEGITAIEGQGQLKIYENQKLIDTLHATYAQLAKVHQVLRVKQMVKDHYYFDFPFARNLGVRFKSTDSTKSKIYEGLDWGSGNFFKSIIIDGNCAIEMAALDINEHNAGDYRYRVIQNDNRELVSWTQPSVFKYTSDGRYKYAYLGLFKFVPGQVIKVEIYNTKNYPQQDAMLIDWRKVEAPKVDGNIQYISKSFRLPDNGLLSSDMNEIKHPRKEYKRKILGQLITSFTPASFNFIETTSLNDIKFRLADSLQNLNFNIGNGKRLYNYRIKLKREIDGHTDSIDFGETNTRFDLYKEFWKNPGKYKITFTPKIYKHGGQPIFLLHNLATSISFTVLPALNVEHSIPVKTASYIILILLTTAAYMFVKYREHQKRIIAKEAQKREIATLKLQSVRAQLNPHFIYNALAGIQNLMNKNDIENANKYLSKFARLTRNVLDDGQKELTSIEQETALLNDYLQMEQLRFGFKFSVELDNDQIDQQIEIPAMLLQPFAENAVKHGVSALKDKGIVTISIKRKENDLLMTVHDNGKGFSGNPTEGKGIKLCEDRVKLLNSIYKNTTILLHKTWGTEGTLITIELKNWL
ncbi:sensor histidine kinase [Mucilaginibacter sp.]|uniref:sensor histidine kinase n=1 Tax=Mucilaginibacter sp. TaxID=1882438 RepID=UPI003D0C4405